MSLVNAETGRRYEITATLGKGGFGTVYRAKLAGEGGFTKTVALKVLNPDAEGVEEFAKRMRDEARILGLIRHRAIVQVDGLVKLNDRWTVVMEYIEGVDLFALDAVPPGPAIEIVAEVAGALHAAYHTIGPSGAPLNLLHRDIKPSNIQLTAQGEVKVLDFGVARADFEGRESATRSLRFGSVGYLSPERMDGTDGPGGDIYALGITAFELLTSERFGKNYVNRKRHDDNVAEKLKSVRQKVGAKHGDRVAEFVGLLLTYDPDHRPDAREVERQCAEVRADVRGQLLRDWAERVVPPLYKRKRPEKDEMSGVVLTEGSRQLTEWRAGSGSGGAAAASPTAPAPAAPASGGGGMRKGLIAAAGGVVVLGVLGGVALGLLALVLVIVAIKVL